MTASEVVKNVVRRSLRALGYEISRARTVRRISLAHALMHLRELGFQPEVVIDVGVGFGTEELYEIFPHAWYLLVEPLHEFEPVLRRITMRVRGEYVLAAASDRQGQVQINVHTESPQGSSLLRESEGSHVDGIPRQVSTVTLDQLRAERQLKGPMLMKVDVQGGELLVLKGAVETLRETEAVVIEVSLFEFQTGAPQLHDVIAWMKQRDFVAYDIVCGHYRPLDLALAQVDMLFVRERGRFRQTHWWATPQQREALRRAR